MVGREFAGIELKKEKWNVKALGLDGENGVCQNVCSCLKGENDGEEEKRGKKERLKGRKREDRRKDEAEEKRGRLERRDWKKIGKKKRWERRKR